jgi:hypothetical protein
MGRAFLFLRGMGSSYPECKALLRPSVTNLAQGCTLVHKTRAAPCEVPVVYGSILRHRTLICRGLASRILEIDHLLARWVVGCCVGCGKRRLFRKPFPRAASAGETPVSSHRHILAKPAPAYAVQIWQSARSKLPPRMSSMFLSVYVRRTRPSVRS